MPPKDLEFKIELLRVEMISVGMSKGLTSPETVQLSQQLDILLNIQQKKPVSSNDRQLQSDLVAE